MNYQKNNIQNKHEKPTMPTMPKNEDQVKGGEVKTAEKPITTNSK